MYHRSFSSGFTLIELLVTLVMLGLISSVVSPAIFKWMESREAATKRTELQNAVSALPLKALFSNSKQIIVEAEQLGIGLDNVTIEKPIVITKNGYCVSGEFTALIGGSSYAYVISDPFCTISLE